jgi:hypothetical protein
MASKLESTRVLGPGSGVCALSARKKIQLTSAARQMTKAFMVTLSCRVRFSPIRMPMSTVLTIPSPVLIPTSYRRAEKVSLDASFLSRIHDSERQFGT